MNKYRLLGASALSVMLASSLPSFANAQDNGPVLDEIIVTAQSRAKGLQEVPISVAAVDASTIEKTGIVKIEDLTTLVPNFTYAETGITTAFLIRGIGSGVNQGFEQSVGVYVDGVHYPRGQQVRAPFLDLERVEVLRGPQSILFGKNSVAGAINVTTARPTDYFQGSAFGSYEIEDGETVLEGMLSGPLSDRIRARVAGRYRDADGFQVNQTLNRDETAREELTLRGTVEVDLTDDLMATFKAEVTSFDAVGRNIEVENAAAVNNPLSPFNGLTYPQILVGVFGQDASVLDFTQDGNRHSNGDDSFNDMETYQMTLDWALGDHTLQAITAFESLTYKEQCDCDFTGANIFLARLQEDYTQFSQELRLTSPERDDFEYILGAYYQSSDHTYADQIIVEANSVLIPAVNGRSPGAGSLLSGTQAFRQAQVDSTVLSAFAQVDWHITEDFTLQLGARVTNEDKDGERNLDITTDSFGALPAAQIGAPLVYGQVFGIASSNLDGLVGLGVPGAAGLAAAFGSGTVPVQNRNVTKFSPDVKLVWDVSDETLLYASWARGFKSGGFDFRANNRGQSASTAEAFQFDDEEATNYEVGGKFKLGPAIELNATAFFTKFDDLQISIFDGILGFNVGNAASSEVKGLELDGRWAVTNNVRLSGGAALTDFEFTDFQNGQCYGTQARDGSDTRFDATTGFCDYSGLKNNLVSDFTGNATMDWNATVFNDYELTGLTTLLYKSSYNASQTQDPAGVQDGYVKLDARLGFGPQDGPWEIAVLGKNLTDEILKTYNGDTPLGGSTFGATSNYTFYSQGRTVALQGSVKF